MKTKSTPTAQHPYLRRLIAFLIDWYLSSLVAMIPTIVFQSINGRDLVLINRIDTLTAPQAVAATGLALVIYTWYFCVLPLRPPNGFALGQTPGRRILGITLVKADAGPLTFRDLFLRDFVGILLLQGNTTSVNIYLMSLLERFTGSIAFVPYLQTFYYFVLALSWILLVTRRKQTFHDLISGARVIVAQPAPGQDPQKDGGLPA